MEAAQLAAYQQAVLLVRQRLEVFARTAWAGLGSYRDGDIDRLVELVVPQVLAGQRQIANLTDAYLSTLAGIDPAGLDAAEVTGSAVRGGVAPEDVYRRPAVTTYTELSRGASLTEAVAAGGKRLLSILATDLQLAKTRQARVSMRRGGFVYYRRVPGRKTCALCLIASTQRYRRGNLLPIHPGCGCNVAKVSAGADPGQVLDPDALEQVHAAISEQLGTVDRGARELGIGKTDAEGKRISDFTELIVVREHGEYGPTLSWRSDKFTGPADI